MSTQYCPRNKNLGQSRCSVFCKDTPYRVPLFLFGTQKPTDVYLYYRNLRVSFYIQALKIELAFRKVSHKYCKIQSHLKFKGSRLFLRNYFYKMYR